MRSALWPDHSVDEHRAETERFLAGSATEPNAVMVAEAGMPSTITGFVELSRRAYAEGCRSTPVAYVEGWYVAPEWRRRGVGRALLDAGETWARTQGCVELASDTEVANATSALAHLRLGFDEVGVIRCFRKAIT